MENTGLPDRRLYERFINDECTEQEVEYLLNHINKHGIEPEFDDLIDKLWERIQSMDLAPGEDAESLFQRIRLRAGIPEKKLLLRRQGVFWRTPMRWAATIALFMVAGITLYRMTATKEVEWREVMTAAGERTMVTLPDSTIVWLNAGSRLSYPVEFNEDERAVRLEGEAFFDVTRDERQPFVITTHSMSTRVLGTSFNIRAYLDESDWQVAVFSGKVSVSAEHAGQASSVILSKGEEVTFSLSLGTLAKSSFADMNEYMGWRHGIIAFDATPISVVLRNLERYYGIPVRLGEGSSPDCVLTGRFEGKKLEDILGVISLSLQGTFKQVDGGYEVNDVNCRGHGDSQTNNE